MPDFRCPRHELVWKILSALNSNLLADTHCYFGGGTRIVLELDEYRESADVDFLCSDREGYRELRTIVTQQSLGNLFSGGYSLLRDVRMDMYGIRTYVAIDDQPVKLEIISEGRIQLTGSRDKALEKTMPVPVLDHVSCVSEKLLANTDRGSDRSTRSRDLIDLAFMAASWQGEDIEAGLVKAEGAYGTSVRRELGTTLALLASASYRALCIKELSVSNNQKKLGRGLRALKKLLA